MKGGLNAGEFSDIDDFAVRERKSRGDLSGAWRDVP
jgi:hypothetical protein